MNPFDNIAQPPKPTRPKKRPRKNPHPKKRGRTWPDSLERKRSLLDILEEKCGDEDPADDLYWHDKDTN